MLPQTRGLSLGCSLFDICKKNFSFYVPVMSLKTRASPLPLFPFSWSPQIWQEKKVRANCTFINKQPSLSPLPCPDGDCAQNFPSKFEKTQSFTPNGKIQFAPIVSNLSPDDRNYGPTGQIPALKRTPTALSLQFRAHYRAIGIQIHQN